MFHLFSRKQDSDGGSSPLSESTRLPLVWLEKKPMTVTDADRIALSPFVNETGRIYLLNKRPRIKV